MHQDVHSPCSLYVLHCTASLLQLPPQSAFVHVIGVWLASSGHLWLSAGTPGVTCLNRDTAAHCTLVAGELPQQQHWQIDAPAAKVVTLAMRVSTAVNWQQ
jgi:hypothetical protein